MRIVIDSQFFLHPASWLHLAETVLAPMVRRRGRLRVWSAGCSTGKEVYSAVMLLDQIAPRTAHEYLATDLDERALAVARAGGPYRDRDIETLTPEERAAYLQPGGPPFFVREALRSRVEFRSHDLRHDPYPTHVDWILYRDVEPFFDELTRVSISRRLHAALEPGGILFMGAVESPPSAEAIGFRRRSPAVYEKVASAVQVQRGS